MVPRQSTLVVAVVAPVATAPTVVVVALAPLIVAPLMMFVRLLVPAVVVAALLDLTLIGSSRPRLPPVFASARAPHH